MATILIIDDRAINREFLSMLLSYANHRILEAENGAIGWEIARAQKPDLIITDIVMPVMSGYRLVEKLRADPATAKIPVIFYTATYRIEEARTKAKEYGVKHIISKPCEPEEIFRIINTILGLHYHVPPNLPSFDGKKSGSKRQSMQDKVAYLEASNLRLTTLLELNFDMSSERGPARLMRMVCRGGGKILSACYTAVIMVDQDGSTLRDFFITENSDQKLIFSAPNTQTPLLKTALKSQHPLNEKNVSIDPRELGLPVTDESIHGFLGVGIVTSKRYYGLLYFVNKIGEGVFDKHDERLALTLADKLAINYENLILYQELEHHSKLLEQEIKQRIKIEATLRESEQNFRQLAESIQEVFWIATPDMRQIIYVSPLYEKTWGRSVDSLYKKPQEWLESVIPIDRERVAQAFSAFSPAEKITLEFRIACPDGSVRWIYARGFPVFNEKGEVYRLAGIAEDITDRKRLEELAFRHKHHLELAELERVNSMGEMASTLAHEINQPLAAITTYTQACIRKLQAKKYSQRELTDIMQLVAQQAERAGVIIHRMKNFIRKGELLLEAVSINNIICNLMPLIDYEARDSATQIQLDLVDSLPLASIDKIQIEQVLLNLVRNAVEAMRNAKTPDPRIILRTETEKDMITVSLIDNGPGLVSGSVPFIFNPYVSTKVSGMGMGLAISRTVVEAHGGHLTASCNPTTGACFQFTLPILKN